jgi:hypothetical protein
MTDTNATTVNLKFHGEDIKDPTDLVLAFSDVQPGQDAKALAWRVIEIPKGISLPATVTYTAQLGVACATEVSGIVSAAGATKPIEVGQCIDLKMDGGHLVWGEPRPIGKSENPEKANLIIYNKTNVKQDVAIVMYQEAALKEPLVLIWNRSPADPGNAQFTFKPTLHTYFAQNYIQGQVIDSLVMAPNKFSKDLAKMEAGKTYPYKITEDPEKMLYTIVDDS